MTDAVWDIAQRRFDALKTTRQRKQRLREIKQEGDGYHDVATTIEMGLIIFRLRGIKTTAKALSDRMYAAALDGTLPTHIERDGAYQRIPPSAYRRPH